MEIDWSEEKQVGWKHNEWTLKGVPLRIEVGPCDVAEPAEAGRCIVDGRPSRAPVLFARAY